MLPCLCPTTRSSRSCENCHNNTSCDKASVVCVALSADRQHFCLRFCDFCLLLDLVSVMSAHSPAAPVKERFDPYSIPERFQKQVQAYLEKARTKPNHFCDCNDFHPDGSCWMFSLKRIYTGIPGALKVYIPIHFLPMLIFRRKQLLKEYCGPSGIVFVFLILF